LSNPLCTHTSVKASLEYFLSAEVLSMTDRVLVLGISEDAHICTSIFNAFGADGYKAICVPSPQKALQLFDGGLEADFLLVDTSRKKPGDSFIPPSLLQKVKSENIGLVVDAGDLSWNDYALRWNVPMIFAMPFGSLDIDMLKKKSRIDALTSSAVAPALAPQYHLEELDNNRFFLAASPVMMQIYRDIRILAPVNIPVLILGESGVGKENVALLLHKYSAGAEKSLLNINCAALPNELLESELFGYEAGAFTGATKSKPGMFELAHKGTLLLDEIGEMSPQMQAKLLHVLQDGSFCRLGARSASHVDVRVLAATNINMEEAIACKRFREDLYYRLNTLTITIPPLRERREEIAPLMRELFRRGAMELGQPVIFADRIVEAAQDYDWPGNLRELRNFVTRTLILRDEKTAYSYLRTKTRLDNVSHSKQEIILPPEIEKAAVAVGMKDAVSVVKNEMEVRMLQSALSASGWNRRRAATNLNISYRTLLYKIKQHRLSA
jgi:two-component system response regulator AtoC